MQWKSNERWRAERMEQKRGKVMNMQGYVVVIIKMAGIDSQIKHT